MSNSIPLRANNGVEAPAIFYFITGIALLFLIVLIGKFLVRKRK